jgi:hypothetical protein
MSEDLHEVVWPLAPLERRQQFERPGAIAQRPSELSRQRIGFVWDYVFSGDVMFNEIRRELAERHPDLAFVEHSTFGNIHGHDEDVVLERLPEVLRATRVDSVILGVGA